MHIPVPTLEVGSTLEAKRLEVVGDNPVRRVYLGTRTEDTLRDGDTLAFTLGRQTIDIGSRRFVARNRYRNTINSFTGVDWWWKSDGTSVRNRALLIP